MGLLTGAEQPQLLSLFSSTSIPALSPIWTTHLPDPSASTSRTSHTTVLPDSTLRPRRSFDDAKIYVPKRKAKGALAHPVLHVQSPNPRSTYIQAGSAKSGAGRGTAKGKQRDPLGIELPWLHLQIRPLGRRPLCFEVGVVDERGNEGVIRVSSFKTTPTSHPYRTPPLIHLPLQLPKRDDTTLTPWLDVTLDLAALLPLFQQLPRPQLDSEEPRPDSSPPTRKKRKMVQVPGGRLRSVSYLRLYANMRIRRIYSTRGGETMQQLGQSVRDEWALYAESLPS